jgi:hypothetical protein
MTAPPQLITRSLTFNFAPTVSAATGLPDVLDISVIPLSSSPDEAAGATFAGGLRSTQIELSAPVNSWTINLIPSNSPGLSAPINYRVLWRAGVMGPTTTYDFAMPDQDLTFDALMGTTGDIIDGTVYLQQSDLGVPGRVARLDNAGNVIDAEGIICATEADVTAVSNALIAETNARSVAVNGLNTTLQAQIASQATSVTTTARNYTNSQVSLLNSDIAGERGARQNADADLQNQITNDHTTQQNDHAANVTAINTITTTLTTKADLVDGALSLSQVPTALIPTAIPVANQAAMLALTSTQVHQGNIVVRPDGVFFFNGGDPAQLSNWITLTVVSSVNGHRGAVSLSAADVNAIPVGGAIAQSQVTGLTTTLLGKAAQTDMTTVQTQLGAVRTQPAIVNLLSTGLLTDASLPADIALVNTFGQVTTKTGTIVSSGGGGGSGISSVNGKTTPIITLTLTDISTAGGSITESQVTGLSTDLSARVLTSDSRLSDARTPTTHASTHGTAGSDPITIATSQVTGLAGILSNNALTSTSNAVNRISSLEGRVTTIEGGGGGGGGGTSTTSVFYDSANTTTEVTDFTQVILHSPWGIDSDGSITGTIDTPYYLHTGVRPADVAYPYISPNGHLNLYRWNESGPADPVYALDSDLTALTTTVGTKANVSDLTALSTTVDTKANQSDLAATNATVATKANQTDLATTNTTVATKANQTDLTTLITTVGTKANQSDMTTVQGNITTINSALTTKADLVSGVLKSTQIPTGIPQANVTSLVSTLAAKADLSGGVLATGQIPTNIPQSSVTGLGTALGNKADLVAGVVPLSQIPLQAQTIAVQVSSQAAMLALTSAQVQVGDFCIITTGVNQGTYILTGSDPSNLANWAQLPGGGGGTVTTVNGYSGPTVTLSASDVGALGASASIPQSQITGLTTALATFATSAALTSGLAGKTSSADVQGMLTNSSFTKRADYVATSAIASLSGLQSVDGVLIPVGALVLATAQASSVNNGLYTASVGAWARPADFATNSYLARDTVVFVQNQTAGVNGTANNATIWQMQVASGLIDTNVNNWTRIGYIATPFTPAAGNGITITGSTFSANVASGGGILAPSGGIQRDPNLIPGKFLGTVPGGSTVAGITHNLNTTSPIVSIWDTASNALVLAGVTVTSANAISIEFASAPTTGQYRICCIG